MPRRMRRAAVLGATAKVASTRGQAKGAAAAAQAAPVTAAPTAEPPTAEPPTAEPPAAAATVPSAASAAENYDTLMKLKALLDAGVLSQEEFEAEKQKILGA